MRLIQRSISMGVTVVAAACSDAVTPNPRPVAHDAQGTWAEDVGNAFIPGSSFSFAMQEAAGTISGSGMFTGEAGPYGALAVSGTAVNDSVHLQIIYVYEATVFKQLTPDTTHFVGVLTSRDHIDGEMTRGSATFPFSLKRASLVYNDQRTP